MREKRASRGRRRRRVKFHQLLSSTAPARTTTMQRTVSLRSAQCIRLNSCGRRNTSFSNDVGSRRYGDAKAAYSCCRAWRAPTPEWADKLDNLDKRFYAVSDNLTRRG